MRWGKQCQHEDDRDANQGLYPIDQGMPWGSPAGTTSMGLAAGDGGTTTGSYSPFASSRFPLGLIPIPAKRSEARVAISCRNALLFTMLLMICESDIISMTTWSRV